MLTLPRLLQIPNVDTSLRFDISPDEKRIVFSWNKTGTWELYRMSLRGRNPEAISHSEEIASFQQTLLAMTELGAKFAPKFSPDGSMLAFALDLDGSESYHIVIHDFKTNTTTDLTPQIAYAHQPNIAWSPDGKMLAVLSDAKGQFALYLLPIDGSPARLLKNIFHPCWDVAWSPDGRWIAVESESVASDRSIHLVPVNRPRKGLRPNTIQLKLDGRILNAQQPAWSPDSKFLAFSAEVDEWHDIGLFNVESEKITWVHQSVGDNTQPAWSRDGELIGWIHAEGAGSSFQFKRRGGAIEQVRVGSGVHAFPQFLGGDIVLLYEDVNHPADLWLVHLDRGSRIQLTKSLDEELDFVQPREIWVGVVPALLYEAKGSRRAVLDIHGGPNWNLQFSWNPVLSHMTSQGWTVIAPNYRGSTGYGKKWQNASRFDMGGVDAEDCAAAAKYLLENGIEKIAVTGRSHGGFLTMCCLTMYPELFAGGSAVVPFLNWFKSHHESREDLQHWNIENMGDPQENEEIWHSHSPYFFLDKIKAPVQMICGENDPRCPASDSIEAHDKLVALGREVELHLYKGEGHSFLKIENVIDAEVKRIEFLKNLLAGDDER